MEIVKLDSIETYCRIFDFKLNHPLVTVIECNEPEKLKPYLMNWGFYALYLKDMASCTISYGKTHYDHGDKSIIAFAPGQVCRFEAIPGKSPKFRGVLFHPDFIHGTPLGRDISRYSFFNYSSNEALHLSPSEFGTIQNIIDIIQTELDNGMDSHTHDILCDDIKLLLDYCVRFYDRQFTERQELNRDVLRRFENLLNDYLHSGKAQQFGIPTVNYFADKICLSPNYFGDLIKRETSVSVKKYMQLKLLEVAKEQLMNPQLTISQVSDALGFLYPQHFVRFFKRMTGITPSEFKNKT
jgi:AraC-like DNA-binding protein